MKIEEWHLIPSEKGYEASDHGRIRNKATGHVKKPGKLPRGYLNMAMGHDRRRYVHHLVAESFLGPRPRGLEINHIDGNKENNRPENLEYVTHSQNQRHAYRVLGTLKLNLPHGSGEKNTMAKLKGCEVEEIKRLAWMGIGQRLVGRMFRISQSTVSNIKSGKTWRKPA